MPTRRFALCAVLAVFALSACEAKRPDSVSDPVAARKLLRRGLSDSLKKNSGPAGYDNGVPDVVAADEETPRKKTAGAAETPESGPSAAQPRTAAKATKVQMMPWKPPVQRPLRRGR